MLIALLLAQLISEDVAAARKAIPVLLGRIRRGEASAQARPGAQPLERFLAAYGTLDSDEAWKLFKRLQRDEPALPWGETGMGRVYVQWKIQDQAEQAFERALRLAPGFSIALVERAILYRSMGRAEAARADAQAALAQDPQDARALLLIAQLDDDAGAPKAQLRTEYGAALAAAPELYEAAAALAADAESSGDTRAALLATEKLAQANPRDGKLQLKLAALRKRAGDQAGAAQALEASLALIPATREVLIDLASLDALLGRREQEEKILVRLHKLEPKARAYVARLFELHKQADPSAALADARMLIELNPADPVPHLYLADRAHDDHDPVTELTELQKAGATERVQALRAELGLPQRALAGPNVNAIYYGAQRLLMKEYEKRREQNAQLAGHLELKVHLDAKGVAQEVDLVQDTVQDPGLAASLRATLKEARYPVKQQTLTFKFDLAPPKGAK